MLTTSAFSRPLRFLVGGILILGSVILTLLLCEWYLKLTNYQPRPLISGGPQRRDQRLFLPDWQLGYTFQYNPPNFLPDTVDDQDHPLHFRPDFRPNRSLGENTFVILMLGDSFTYGHMVGDRQAMPSQVEETLIRSGYDVNVLNAGVSGYGTDQMYVFASRIVKRMKPDLVVMNVHVTDLYDNNDYCLFRKVGQHYWPVGAVGFLEGLQLALVVRLPAPITTSRLGNLALSRLNDRVNLACSIPNGKISEKEREALLLDKMVYLLSDLRQKLEKQDIKMMITLGTFQAYFEPTAPEHLYGQIEQYERLKAKLEAHFEVVDVTKAVVEVQRTVHLAQDRLSTPSATLATTAIATNPTTLLEATSAGQVAGAQTSSSSLFFNDAKSEPYSKFGHFHLNPYGNRIFADTIVRKILETYPLPR